MEEIGRVQLSEIAELITKGTTPTTLGYEFQEEGVNFLKIECFDENGGFIENKAAHISEECHEKLKRSQLMAGDVLFSIAGAIGRVAIVTEEMLPANTNQALAIIRISDEQVYLPYIKLILTSPIVIEQFERKKQGVAQLNLSLKDINEISIPLPNKDKQIELAKLFDKVTGVIAKRNMELSALDELIKARFVELFGDPMLNPKCFPIKTIDEVAVLNKGITYSPEDVADEGMIVLRSSNIKGNVFDLEDLVKVTKNILPDKYVKENDILMCNRNGSTRLVGKVAMIPKLDENMTFGTFMTIVRSDIYEFLFAFFQMDAFREQIKFQTAVAINQISLPLLASVKVPVPPRELIDEFATFTKQVDKSKFIDIHAA